MGRDPLTDELIGLGCERVRRVRPFGHGAARSVIATPRSRIEVCGRPPGEHPAMCPEDCSVGSIVSYNISPVWISSSRNRLSNTASRKLRSSSLWLTAASSSTRPHRLDHSIPDDRSIYLGDDEHGTALEVVAIALDDERLLIVHAMKLRGAYREQYEEALPHRRLA